MYSNPKQWAHIRRRVLVLGHSISQVSREERMTRKTVRKIILNEKPPLVGRPTEGKLCARTNVTLRAKPLPQNQTTELKWNNWLAALERGEAHSVLSPSTAQDLTALLSPVPARQRKKALVVLAYDQGFSMHQISRHSGVSSKTVRVYLDAFNANGIDGLLQRKQREKLCYNIQLRDAVFQKLHEPPSLSGLNRTIWRLKDLRKALADKDISVGADAIRQVIKSAGYRWRSAKVVLTSTDPEYREKLAHVQSILNGLTQTERFFSIDEYGPFAIKLKGGTWLVGPDENPSVPQWQKSKGWLILTAALELSTNQVTHFYSTAKNTNEMIRMIAKLVEEYNQATKLFISWDAASWHMSKGLVNYIEAHNVVAVVNSRPSVELVPLPASAQFLNVIESVFSGMARSIMHGSNYESKDAAIQAINLYFEERNKSFKANPRRAGNKIWGKERNPSEFSSGNNCKDPAYR